MRYMTDLGLLHFVVIADQGIHLIEVKPIQPHVRVIGKPYTITLETIN